MKFQSSALGWGSFGGSSGQRSGEVWCYRQFMMAAKISNLSRHHFLGKFNIYVTDPASWNMITRKEKTNKKKKTWDHKADLPAPFHVGLEVILGLCPADQVRLIMEGQWGGHIKGLRSWTGPGWCWPQTSAVLLRYSATEWMFIWTPGIIFQTGAPSNTRVKLVRRSINSCQASSVDW